MNVNYSRMKKNGSSIKKLWDKAEEIKVKTEAGTDVTFNVSGMEAIANIGEYHEPGMGGNMPAGEVYIPPAGFRRGERKSSCRWQHENRKWRNIAAKPGYLAHQGRKSNAGGKEKMRTY